MVTADMDLALSAINASAVVGQKVWRLILLYPQFLQMSLLSSKLNIQGGMESGRKDNTKQTNELLLRAL